MFADNGIYWKVELLQHVNMIDSYWQQLVNTIAN